MVTPLPSTQVPVAMIGSVVFAGAAKVSDPSPVSIVICDVVELVTRPVASTSFSF